MSIIGIGFFFVLILFNIGSSVTHIGWTTVHAFLFEMISVIPTTLFLFFFYPYYEKSSNKINSFLKISALSIVSYLLSFYSFTYLITLLPSHIEKFEQSISFTNYDNLFYMELNPIQFLPKFAWVSISFLVLIPINKLLQSNSIYLENEKRFKDLQLNLLQQQLTPHYLFNELNNIYSLSILEDSSFKKYISHLEHFLKLIKLGGQKSIVSTKSELDLITNYIEFQQIRLKNNIDIKVHFSEPPMNLEVLSLSYFILIENAIKHCKYTPETKGLITVSFKFENGISTFYVKNSFLKNSSVRIGKGLHNLNERMEKYYSSNHSLLHKMDNSFYKTTLTINHNKV